MCRTRYPTTPLRCIALEAIASTFLTPCPYASEGCSFRGMKADVAVHKDECLKRPLACPLCKTDLTNPDALNTHLKEQHEVRCFNGNRWDSHQILANIYTINFDGSFFFVEHMTLPEMRGVKILLLNHTKPDTKPQYKFSIELTKGHQQLKQEGTVKSIDQVDWRQTFSFTIHEKEYQSFMPVMPAKKIAYNIWKQ